MRGLMLLLAILLAVPAWAQPLVDPTRPAGAGSTPVVGAAPAAVTPVLELQTLLVSPHRRVAIINGRALSVGDTIDGAELLEIRDDEVLLRFGRQVLRLAPVGRQVTKVMKGMKDSQVITGMRQ